MRDMREIAPRGVRKGEGNGRDGIFLADVLQLALVRCNARFIKDVRTRTSFVNVQSASRKGTVAGQAEESAE